ncbi:DUF397 domain-containing protein [Streptomyces sp. NPDC023723]|uniref:DUF397 domain-containing protein n=1 Tax=Streptomyces sp. NPDC023723 TaxID=3154323 RepID=UPI0033E56A27
MTSKEERFPLDLRRAVWCKSSHSDAAQQCLEIAANYPGIVPVRDSKAPEGPALVFPRVSFAAFVTAVGVGEFGAI